MTGGEIFSIVESPAKPVLPLPLKTQRYPSHVLFQEKNMQHGYYIILSCSDEKRAAEPKWISGIKKF